MSVWRLFTSQKSLVIAFVSELAPKLSTKLARDLKPDPQFDAQFKIFKVKTYSSILQYSCSMDVYVIKWLSLMQIQRYPSHLPDK
jgi:hypothetical protein